MGRPLKIAKIYGSTPVDSGFDNPEGSANTYGVVGGITSLSDQQVLTRVAIGSSISGIFASTTEANIGGIGTDFGNTVLFTTGTILQNEDGTIIGTIASIEGKSVATTVSSAASTDLITVNDTTGFLVGVPVVFGAAIGGLTAGVVYYVESVPDGTTFSVSATVGGAALELSDDTVVTTATVDAATLTAPSSVDLTNSSIVYSTNQAGSIIRQKGKRKYLVAENVALVDEVMISGSTYRIVSTGDTDWQSVGAGADATSGKIFVATGAGAGTGTVNRVGVCQTANLANAALTANRMNLVGTTAAPATVLLDSLTNYFGTDFTDNGTDENAGTKYVVSFNGAVAANVTLGYPNGVIDIQSA